MTITIQLKRYVDALIGIKEFAVLDKVEADEIRNISGYETLCTIDEGCNGLFFLRRLVVNPQLDALLARRKLIKEFVDKGTAKYGEDMRKILEMQCERLSDEQITKRLQSII